MFQLACLRSMAWTSCLKHGTEDCVQLNGKETRQSMSSVCQALNSSEQCTGPLFFFFPLLLWPGAQPSGGARV